MEHTLLYWHWIILGVALILSELVITTFFILWFGAAALVVAIVLLIAPTLPVSLQILIWTALSVILAALWFKYLKPLSTDKTMAGLSREAIIGQAGQVIRPPVDDNKGLLRFPAPILGDDEWMIISAETLQAGDRVRVIDVVGNALLVAK